MSTAGDRETFTSVTGVTDSNLIDRYLEMSNGNVQDAIALYFDNPPADDQTATAPDTTAATMAVDSTPASGDDGSGDADRYVTRVDHSGFGPQGDSQRPFRSTAGQTRQTTTSSSGRTTSGRMMTLRDLASGGQDGGDDDDEGDTKRFFAGGSTGSGQQIIGQDPTGGGRIDPEEFFRRVRQQGGVDREQFVRQVQEDMKFKGKGRRLGTQPTSTHEIEEPPSPILRERTERTVVLNFWSNGFSIGDDGELRRFDDPANRDFLDSINRGVVPEELESTENEDIVFEIVRHPTEYRQPEKKFKAFAGTGKTLASDSSSAPAATSDTKPVEKLSSYECDMSRPHTTLQIRLADSRRIVAKFNLDDTINTVRGFVAALTDHPNPVFDLQTSFPRKVLTDFDLTIEEAGLKNAAIIQVMRN